MTRREHLSARLLRMPRIMPRKAFRCIDNEESERRERQEKEKKRVGGRETSGERRKVNQPRTYGLPSHLTGSGQYSISQMHEQRKIQSSPKGNLTSPNFESTSIRCAAFKYCAVRSFRTSFQKVISVCVYLKKNKLS